MPRITPQTIIVPGERAFDRVRHCEYPGCSEDGLHRAPVARDRLNEFYWFCLAHVRAYNEAWDYYKGMSETEIEAHRRADTIWQRPSWPFSSVGTCGNGTYAGIHDGFGFFAEDDAQPTPKRRQTEQDMALAVLDLFPPVTLAAVKTRYRQLVKQLHPDANGGDKLAEERLKVINQAYTFLKTSLAD